MGGCIGKVPKDPLQKYCLSPKSSFKNYLNEVMLNNQKLFRIEGDKLKQLLHRSIGALTFLNVYKKMSTASGFLISNNVVLTAAHNIYDKDFQEYNTCFQFYFGANGTTQEIYQVQSWRFPEQFKTKTIYQSFSFDYAIMKLKKPFDFREYLPLSFPCQMCLLQSKDKELSVYGFPGSLQDYYSLDQKGVKRKLYQYGLTRKDRIVLINSSSFEIGYGISTLAGQSGSPVTIDDAVIAIHIGGFQSRYNIGRIIDATLVTNIRKWVEQLGAFPFEIQCNNVCKYTNQTVDKFITRELRLTVQGISTIDLARHRNLLKLDLYNNKIWQINLGVCPLLRQVQLGRNLLKEIDVSSNINLTGLQLPQNYLQYIVIRSNIALQHLSLQSNKIDSIDLSFNTKLHSLDISENNLSEVDLKNNEKLSYINLWMNQIGALDLSHHPHLQFLYASNNGLVIIDLTSNPKLRGLSLTSNKLQKLILPVSENTDTRQYIKYFSFSNQDSKKCKVYMKCDKKGINKALQIVAQWKLKYQSQEHNENNCQYSFFVQL